jgi:hypothetical protein
MDSWGLTVDGHDWRVKARPSQPGVYDFDWLTGPHAYGFTSKTSDGSAISVDDMREAISDFLAGINPETGYLD